MNIKNVNSNNVIQIEPIDFEDDVALGISLPLVNGTGGYFKQTYTTFDQAKTNFKNLILTNKGERYMQPEFGCDMLKYLFEPMSQDFHDNIRNSIIESTSYWLPYLEIRNIDMVEDERNLNMVHIDIDIGMINNSNIHDVITFKFVVEGR